MLLAIAPTRKRAVAAARLSTLYVAGVGLLTPPVLGALDALGGLMDGLAFVASPLGAWFAATFVLLAVVRRAAFVALWLLTLVVWMWQWEIIGPTGFFAGGGFTLWSLVAAPLYAITVVGFEARQPLTLARRVASAIGIGGWLAAAAAGIVFQHGFGPMGCLGGVATTGVSLLDRTIEAAWLAMPPLVALDAIRRVCRVRRIEATLE